jgi:hypothetical protein
MVLQFIQIDIRTGPFILHFSFFIPSFFIPSFFIPSFFIPNYLHLPGTHLYPRFVAFQ